MRILMEHAIRSPLARARFCHYFTNLDVGLWQQVEKAVHLKHVPGERRKGNKRP